MRRIHVVLGWLQAVALVGFAVSIVVNALRVGSTVGKPEAEAVIYVIFGAMFAVTSRGLQRGRKAARTPFALLQVFVLIAGYTFLVGTSSAAKAVGAVVLASGAAALVSLLRNGGVDIGADAVFGSVAMTFVQAGTVVGQVEPHPPPALYRSLLGALDLSCRQMAARYESGHDIVALVESSLAAVPGYPGASDAAPDPADAAVTAIAQQLQAIVSRPISREAAVEACLDVAQRTHSALASPHPQALADLCGVGVALALKTMQDDVQPDPRARRTARLTLGSEMGARWLIHTLGS